MGYLYPPENKGTVVEFSATFVGIICLVMAISLLALMVFLLVRCVRKKQQQMAKNEFLVLNIDDNESII